MSTWSVPRPRPLSGFTDAGVGTFSCAALHLRHWAPLPKRSCTDIHSRPEMYGWRSIETRWRCCDRHCSRRGLLDKFGQRISTMGCQEGLWVVWR